MMDAQVEDGRSFYGDERKSWPIYAGLAVTVLIVAVGVVVLTRAGGGLEPRAQSDTPYHFAYRDPNIVIRNTNRIIMDTDVSVVMTAHQDRPETVLIGPGDASQPPNGRFTWTITPELGAGGPTQIAGEVDYQGVIYRVCEGIIGSPRNFPPVLNRLYAEQYFPIDNVGSRYRTPRQVDAAPFVAFMRAAIADTASFDGNGGLPTHRLRAMAGALIGFCTAA
jgi:hypothetical protein